MRHLALAVVLACVFSGTALAGEIPSGDRTPPGLVIRPAEIPPCDGTTPQVSSTGEIPSIGVTESESSDIMLTIFLSIFSIVR